MKTKLLLAVIGGVLAASVIGAAVWLGSRPSKTNTQTPPPATQTLSGNYRCWQYNVSGGGGSCRLAPPFVFNEDGTYTMSREQGTYTITDNTIILSESEIRGPGTLLENGNQIRFEYDYQGRHHTVTYLREGH